MTELHIAGLIGQILQQSMPSTEDILRDPFYNTKGALSNP